MAFMVPDIQEFTRAEAIEYVCESAQETEDYTAGFYARLSAPGYLDATDWSGPFATEEEALAYLVETYDLCKRCKEEDAPETDLCEKCQEEEAK